MAGDDLTREAEQRLAAALERIADMAHGLARIPAGLAPPSPPPSGPAPDAAEIVARLDALIERLRAALGQPAAH